MSEDIDRYTTFEQVANEAISYGMNLKNVTRVRTAIFEKIHNGITYANHAEYEKDQEGNTDRDYRYMHVYVRTEDGLQWNSARVFVSSMRLNIAVRTALAEACSCVWWERLFRSVGTPRIQILPEENVRDVAMQAAYEIDVVLQRYGLELQGPIDAVHKL